MLPFYTLLCKFNSKYFIYQKIQPLITLPTRAKKGGKPNGFPPPKKQTLLKLTHD